MFILGNLVHAMAVVIDNVFKLYGFVIMVAVLITWVSPDPFNPLVQLLRGVTEPLFDWVRQHVPFARVGMLDLSPMLVLFLLWFLRIFLVQSLLDVSVRLR